MKKTLIKLSLLGSLALVGCATPTVSYMDANARNTLNTNYNQQDLDAAAQAMATDLIQDGSINQCKAYTISQIQNRTDQVIETGTTTRKVTSILQKAKLKPLNVSIVGSYSQNQDAEMNEQQSGKFDDSTVQKMGKRQAADCRLDGILTSDSQTNGKQTEVTYTFEMVLIQIQKGIILWQNDDKIAKGLK